MATKAELQAALVDVTEIPKARRGRKPVHVEGLAELLQQVGPGKAAKLGVIFGKVPEAQRSKISQQIRSHWAMVQDDKCSISWLPDGTPAVAHR